MQFLQQTSTDQLKAMYVGLLPTADYIIHHGLVVRKSDSAIHQIFQR